MNDSVWPGLGIFGESYIVFSIGTLQPVWQVVFPDCLQGDLTGICSDALLNSLSYSVVAGIITGMIGIGLAANIMGRRAGSILTAAIMASGAVALLLISCLLTSTPSAMFKWMSVALFIFGVGVGGEYPLAASSASEKAMGEMQRKMKLELQQEESDGLLVIDEHDDDNSLPAAAGVQSDRGRQIQLVFTMQGAGIFCNSLVMTVLLLITGQVGTDDYNVASLLVVWRISYAIGAAVLIYVLHSRWHYLQESQVWQDDKQRRNQLARNAMAAADRVPDHHHQHQHQYNQYPGIDDNLSTISEVSSLSAPSVANQNDDDEDDGILNLKQVPSTDPADDLRSDVWSLLLRNYGVRLVGVSLSWMFWDVAFYGNKLFQSSFLLTLSGESTTLLEFSIAATLNSAVALAGYLGAAAIIDHPSVGRRGLQQWGFLLTGGLFVGVGFLYDNLSNGVLMTMYLGSSFFGQLGPNATTFLIPAEIFPTEMRTTCHGIAAASGKVGALFAAIMFNYVGDLDMFLLSGYASFAACAVTFWTIPETTGLDLYEVDRKWRMTLDGRKGEYEGDANHRKYLSFFERNKASMQSSLHDTSAHSYVHDAA